MNPTNIKETRYEEIIELLALPGRRHILGNLSLPRSHAYVKVNINVKIYALFLVKWASNNHLLKGRLIKKRNIRRF